MTDLPVTGKEKRFIQVYTECEDLEEVRKRLDLTKNAAKAFWKKHKVEIERRLDKVHDYQAKLLAKAAILQAPFLDEHLVVAVKKGAARGDIRALELGYQRLQLLRDGNFIGWKDPDKAHENAGQPAQPPIFRVERTVTRTEQVTESQQLSGHPPQNTIEATATTSASAPRPAVKILQY